ncbi:hypothetical protein EV182_003564, partial [Spiromyces aspiralis]
APEILSFPVFEGKNTVGKNANCQICIPDTFVSGNHCQITVRGDLHFICDLGTTNGTCFKDSTATRRDMKGGSQRLVPAAATTALDNEGEREQMEDGDDDEAWEGLAPLKLEPRFHYQLADGINMMISLCDAYYRILAADEPEGGVARYVSEPPDWVRAHSSCRETGSGEESNSKFNIRRLSATTSSLPNVSQSLVASPPPQLNSQNHLKRLESSPFPSPSKLFHCPVNASLSTSSLGGPKKLKLRHSSENSPSMDRRSSQVDTPFLSKEVGPGGAPLCLALPDLLSPAPVSKAWESASQSASSSSTNSSAMFESDSNEGTGAQPGLSALSNAGCTVLSRPATPDTVVDSLSVDSDGDSEVGLMQVSPTAAPAVEDDDGNSEGERSGGDLTKSKDLLLSPSPPKPPLTTRPLPLASSRSGYDWRNGTIKNDHTDITVRFPNPPPLVLPRDQVILVPRPTAPQRLSRRPRHRRQREEDLEVHSPFIIDSPPSYLVTALEKLFVQPTLPTQVSPVHTQEPGSLLAGADGPPTYLEAGDECQSSDSDDGNMIDTAIAKATSPACARDPSGDAASGTELDREGGLLGTGEDRSTTTTPRLPSLIIGNDPRPPPEGGAVARMPPRPVDQKPKSKLSSSTLVLTAPKIPPSSTITSSSIKTTARSTFVGGAAKRQPFHRPTIRRRSSRLRMDPSRSSSPSDPDDSNDEDYNPSQTISSVDSSLQSQSHPHPQRQNPADIMPFNPNLYASTPRDDIALRRRGLLRKTAFTINTATITTVTTAAAGAPTPASSKRRYATNASGLFRSSKGGLSMAIKRSSAPTSIIRPERNNSNNSGKFRRPPATTLSSTLKK